MDPSLAISLLTLSALVVQPSFVPSLGGFLDTGDLGTTTPAGSGARCPCGWAVRTPPWSSFCCWEVLMLSKNAGGGGDESVLRWNDTDLLSFERRATKPSTVGAFISRRRSAPSGGRRLPLESSREMRFRMLFRFFLSGVSVLSGEESGGETSSLGTWRKLGKCWWQYYNKKKVVNGTVIITIKKKKSYRRKCFLSWVNWKPKLLLETWR